ncbi:MAG: hypothetical protein EDM03_08590 [Porphyrobacter sp. IPPAS B-1204]|nr:MAG: hypothetical protein EDM03_08590 [Porphyrobacter sp. IPPAS B-1204]
MANRHTAGCASAASFMLCAQPCAAQNRALTLDLDEPIQVEANGTSLEIALDTGGVNRLTLHPQTAAGLEADRAPAEMYGKGRLRIGLTRILNGRVRVRDLTIEGVPYRARVLWFEGASGGAGDGSVGPFAIPFDHIAIRLGGTSTETYTFPLIGGFNRAAGARFTHDGGEMLVKFAVEESGDYPVASAAAGAAIAAAYDGVATGKFWGEHIAFGIYRPVQLVRLGRPLVIGPFRFDEIAVRVRARVDGSGSGDQIPPPPRDWDPSGMVVIMLTQKGPPPVFSFRIPRPVLLRWNQLEYIKSAKEIRLSC